MRVHFQETPWDLVFCIGYAVVIASLLLALGQGNYLAIVVVLFVPGYVLVAALYPRREDLDWIERVVLSSGLSIAVVPFLGLALSLTSVGIHFGPVVLITAAFSVLVGLAAWWRRIRLPTTDRLSATIYLSIPTWKDYAFVDKTLTVALLACVIAAGASLAYVLASPRADSGFTEFYVLGPDGNASGYPTHLAPSQPGTVVLEITNHEAASANYAVRVDLVGIRVVYNTTTGGNETLEVNRTTLSWINASVADGQDVSQLYTFTISRTGFWKVQFLLFKDGDLSSSYRETHLYV